MKSIVTMIQKNITSDKREIIDRIWQRLKELGLDPSDVNKKLNMSEAWIYNYLRGERKFKRAQIEVLAQGLNCNPDWLQYGNKYQKDHNVGNILQFNQETRANTEN